VRVRIWGARGSVPSPGPETVRYGGNTSCVQVTLDDGTELALDAGTGIRNLGLAMPRDPVRLQILLTHLHLDHIQGLMFFAPAFREPTEITIWGPPSPQLSLKDRIGRYISSPLTPVEMRELPCEVDFRDVPDGEWRIGSATIKAAPVAHRGPTLGYRITEGDVSLCYLPDHEPGLGTSLDNVEDEWISGFELAKDASLLIHDCQYMDGEYGEHTGWGHSRLRDALDFARRTQAKRVLLFHHDPLHSDDALDAMYGTALDHWCAAGGDPEQLEMAVERRELRLQGRPAAPASGLVSG
jgi:phosphoribosyl 1,2-cyclic phosphodiesterase